MSAPDHMPSPPADTPRSSRPGRVLRLVLVLSLALNLLFIGVVIGGALRMPRHDAGALAPAGDLRALWRAMPPEARAGLREREAPRLSRAERHERDEAQGRRLAALLLAEPFDPVGFAAALDGYRGELEEDRRAMHAALAAQIAALTSSERARLARVLDDD